MLGVEMIKMTTTNTMILASLLLVCVSFLLHLDNHDHGSNDKNFNSISGKITRYTCSDYFEPDDLFGDWDSCEIVVYNK